MKILVDRKGKTVDEMTRIKEKKKSKEHMPVSKIDESTPDKTHQINLIADLTEEEYLEFAGMCG